MYREVYQAIDASIVSLTCLPSSEAVVHRALCAFRALDRDRTEVDQLTRMSVELQLLAASTMRGDLQGRRAATERLLLAARQWMDRIPMQ